MAQSKDYMMEKTFCLNVIKEHFLSGNYGDGAELVTLHKNPQEGKDIYLKVSLEQIRINPGVAVKIITETEGKVPYDWTDDLSETALNYCLNTGQYEEMWNLASLYGNPQKIVLESCRTKMKTFLNGNRQMSRLAIKLISGVEKHAPEALKESIYNNLQEMHASLVVNGSKAFPL
jgi:hypothetical protein